ncbi:hypothetical protein BSKO_13793 [Bryopsis sp. KO-2023]|nr:hypothetical protein BSKO_13793 [Bryopsis sp. KO-2023]
MGSLRLDSGRGEAFKQGIPTAHETGIVDGSAKEAAAVLKKLKALGITTSAYNPVHCFSALLAAGVPKLSLDRQEKCLAGQRLS